MKSNRPQGHEPVERVTLYVCPECGRWEAPWREGAEPLCNRHRRSREMVQMLPVEYVPVSSSQEPGDGEVCKRCGWLVAASCPTWWSAPDALWNEVEGGPGGIRCIRCFTEDCEAKGVTVYWRAVVDGGEAKEPSEAEVERAAMAMRAHDEAQNYPGYNLPTLDYFRQLAHAALRAASAPTTEQEGESDG